MDEERQEDERFQDWVLRRRETCTYNAASEFYRQEYGEKAQLLQAGRSSAFNEVGVALKRAAARAREIARRTGTPLIIYKNGHILKEMVEKKNE